MLLCTELNLPMTKVEQQLKQIERTIARLVPRKLAWTITTNPSWLSPVWHHAGRALQLSFKPLVNGILTSTFDCSNAIQ